jgi:protein subunit release factor A
MRDMAHLEIVELETNLAKPTMIKVLLVPKDPNDEKNVILEIPRRNRRRRSDAFRGGSSANVCALRRAARLENGNYGRG